MNILSREFYITIITSKAAWVKYLQNNALLGIADAHSPCHKCISQMLEKMCSTCAGELVPTLRCLRKGCQTRQKICSGLFFNFTDLNNSANLHLTQMVVNGCHRRSPYSNWWGQVCWMSQIQLGLFANWWRATNISHSGLHVYWQNPQVGVWKTCKPTSL